MDTSKTYKWYEDPVYIKMCEKAEEIQEHQIIDGDYYYWSVDDKVHIAYTESHKDYVVKHPEQWDYLNGRKVIWLPRQDNLQEMLPKVLLGQWGFVKLTELFADFVCDEQTRTRFSFHSMEQLWLAFVMKEKYNKVWSGTEWIAK